MVITPTKARWMAGPLDHYAGTLDHYAGTLDHYAGALDHYAGALDHCAGALGHYAGALGHCAALASFAPAPCQNGTVPPVEKLQNGSVTSAAPNWTSKPVQFPDTPLERV